MLRDPASLRECSKAVSGPQLTGKPAGMAFLAKVRRVGEGPLSNQRKEVRTGGG